MKRVLKGTEPASFTTWKASATDDWQPSYPALSNPQKRELHVHLLQEQGFFCCYCGREIGLDDSHIEHFRPQERYQDLALSYENLFASCIRETKPGNPLHCGHRKGSWFDEAAHISPSDEYCEEYFGYTLLGRIQESEDGDGAAEAMINALHLDTPYLVNRRKEAIQKVFDISFINDATPAELTTLARSLRSTPLHEQAAFDHVIARYAERLAVT